MSHKAIRALYPNVVTIDDSTGSFDQNGNLVEIDLVAVNAKLTEMQAEEIVKQEAQIAAKQSAMAKLSALGLTEDEVKALLG